MVASDFEPASRELQSVVDGKGVPFVGLNSVHANDIASCIHLVLE